MSRSRDIADTNRPIYHENFYLQDRAFINVRELMLILGLNSRRIDVFIIIRRFEPMVLNFLALYFGVMAIISAVICLRSVLGTISSRTIAVIIIRGLVNAH
jgi:hypothetical protein